MLSFLVIRSEQFLSGPYLSAVSFYRGYARYYNPSKSKMIMTFYCRTNVFGNLIFVPDSLITRKKKDIIKIYDHIVRKYVL